MHLQHVFAEGELDPAATRKDFLQVRQEGVRTVRRKVGYYNLDAIISVGYRVKSKVATQFRMWATERLREHLVRGYTVNEQRLEQLGSLVQILARSSDELVGGVADVLAAYLPGLTLLRDYDAGRIETSPEVVPRWELTIAAARSAIAQVGRECGY
ncbi:MAG: RhuM family protein [Herbiconiux sp.]|nr:RhuM family protein [Herbiconiux sp.]